MIIRNKHFGKIEKNTSDQHCSMTLNCVGPLYNACHSFLARQKGKFTGFCNDVVQY